MMTDDDLVNDLKVSLGDADPSADEVSAARARLVGHLQRETGRRRAGRLPLVVRWAGPLLAGLAILVVLAPAGGGGDALDPHCLSAFGYAVPCEAWLSLVVAVATAGVVGLALRLAARTRDLQ